MTAREAAIASVGRRRSRGRPRTFDREIRVAVDAELDRRVRSFAAIQDITVSAAWRALAEQALDETET